MATVSRRWTRDRLVQGGVVLLASTLALTASFLGLVALATGSVTGLSDRLPYYVLAMAIAFVGGVVFFEGELRDGGSILFGAVAVAIGTFLIVSLGGEGIAYAVQRPDQVLTSQLLFYLLAAGLIGTGLGYWGVRHWSEVTGFGSGI